LRIGKSKIVADFLLFNEKGSNSSRVSHLIGVFFSLLSVGRENQLWVETMKNSLAKRPRDTKPWDAKREMRIGILACFIIFGIPALLIIYYLLYMLYHG